MKLCSQSFLCLVLFPKPVLFGSFPCDPLSPHSVSKAGVAGRKDDVVV